MNDQLIDEWLKNQDSKEKSCIKSSYKHFDSKVSKSDYAINGKYRKDLYFSNKLNSLKFWPLIRIDQKKRRYSKDLEGKLEIKQKNRSIMYPAHRDSCIMSFYAFVLRKNYEYKLKNSTLNDSILGYRKIPIAAKSKRNKSNINFANDLFKSLQTLNGYTVLCIDIKGFFDSINHSVLRKAIEPFSEDLPKNNLQFIIKIVTKYKYVFYKDVEYVMGKNSWINPKKYNRFIRNTVLEHKNNNAYGIPQGTPISDILSNIYLYDFDNSINNKLAKLPKPTIYKRYCDDILVAIPDEYAKEIYAFILNEIKKYKLEIGANKTEAFYIEANKKIFIDITKKFVKKYTKNKEFLQYLGFYMNLNKIIMRSPTVEKHYRKIKKINGTRHNVDGAINKNPLDTYEKISSKIINNLSIQKQVLHIRRHSKKILRESAINKKIKNY
ncbi:hypothetical protein IJG92_00120 [Candidatus Saccharibacteria bacterium]|nr:hypothetical protein [Candidatus Saccharibacteria bacterium]